MINVKLDTNSGTKLLSMFFMLKLGLNAINSKIESEKKAVQKSLDDIQKSKESFDMRFNTTKQFFNNPMESKSMPKIKQSQIKTLDAKMDLIYKNKDRINSYNKNVSSVKNAVLYNEIRRNTL